MLLLIFVALIATTNGGLLTDYQQMDSNILDHANVYLLNKLESNKAVELAVIVDSEFGKVSDFVQTIENWIFKQDSDTRITFYRWVEDVKRQSEIAKNIFESKTSEFNWKIIQVFRKALVCFFFFLKKIKIFRKIFIEQTFHNRNNPTFIANFIIISTWNSKKNSINFIIKFMNGPNFIF